MKPLSIIGLFLFALAACVQKPQVPEPVEGPSPELSAIDTQMWRQPDSALARLLPWFDTCCRDAACHVSTATAYNRHYANLLLSELLYKKSRTRCRVEHIFGFMENTMHRLYIRTVGLARATAVIGLINLTYNMSRYEQIVRLNLLKTN